MNRSEVHKGQIPWNKGKKGLQIAWNKNKPWSDETKARMRLARLGKKPWNKGIIGVYKHPDSTIRKMSEFQRTQLNNTGRFQKGRANPLKGTGGDRHSWDAKYRSLKKNNLLETADLREIEKFYLLAEMLTTSMGTKYVVDHIIPLSKGGFHHQGNLQVITLSDNSKKRDKFPFQLTEKHFPVGYANTAEDLFFCPDNTYIELA